MLNMFLDLMLSSIVLVVALLFFHVSSLQIFFPLPQAIQPREFDHLKSQYTSQIKEIFDGLTKKYHEVDM